MVRKEDLRYIRTNRRLFETFFELITDKMIENLSITDICESAKINRATFYKHFNDRKEFVMYCVAQKLREIRLEQRGREQANAATIYEDALCEMFAFLRYVQSVNADNLKSDSHTVRMLYDAMLNYYFLEFSSFYKKAKKLDPTSAEAMAAYRVGSLLSIVFFNLMKGEEGVSEQACEDAIRFFVTKIKDCEV